MYIKEALAGHLFRVFVELRPDILNVIWQQWTRYHRAVNIVHIDILYEHSPCSFFPKHFTIFILLKLFHLCEDLWTYCVWFDCFKCLFNLISQDELNFLARWVHCEMMIYVCLYQLSISYKFSYVDLSLMPIFCFHFTRVLTWHTTLQFVRFLVSFSSFI